MRDEAMGETREQRSQPWERRGVGATEPYAPQRYEWEASRRPWGWGYGSVAGTRFGHGVEPTEDWRWRLGGDASWRQGSSTDVGRSVGTFRGRGPKGYQRSDERIREDVCDLLTENVDLDASDVQVTVIACEITLQGSVPSRQDKRLAEDLAESVSGVRNVHNQLRVRDAELPRHEGDPGIRAA
jgi:hypothetical protein